MGQQERLARFIAEYAEKGYQFAYGLCGSPEEAKELLQEAFYRLVRKRAQYDPGQSMDNWFMAILRNVYVDSVKRYERRQGVSLDVLVPGGPEEGLSFADVLPDDREEAALDRLARQDDVGLVRLAMECLSTGHKAILTLCDLQGLKYEEVAQVLDCPLGTVRSRMNRARAALKKAILGVCKEVDDHGM